MRRYWAACFAAIALAAPAQALEVRVAPSDFVVLNPINPSHGLSDLVLPAVGVRAGAGESCCVTRLRVELMVHGKARLTEEVPPETLVADTREFIGEPVPAAVGAELLNAGGPDGFFHAPTRLAAGPQLHPGEALFTLRRYYSVAFQPDAARVSVTCGAATAQSLTPIRRHDSPIAYRLPLQGAWLMKSVPIGVDSHHRLNPATEFAVDFFRVDAEGRPYKGDRLDVSTWYGWGQPVLAAADGVVTRVIANQVQDRASFAPRPGETRGQFEARVGAAAIARLRADFAGANAGNLVVIRHAAAGRVEYSAYGHLKPGSLRVAVGDVVRQGQKIAEVGDTGDTPVIHLHFQVNAGPDPFFDRSLPVAFADLDAPNGPELGRFVSAPPPPGAPSVDPAAR